MSRVATAAAVPVELFRDVLRRDAPNREMIAAKFEAGVALATLAMILVILALDRNVERAMPFAFGVSIPLLVYALLVLRALRRGWYWRHLPLLSTLVELSALAGAATAELRVDGPASILTSPGFVLWGAILVFGSVRMEPRVCLVAGTVSAVGWTIAHFALGAHAEQLALSPRGAVVRATFLLTAGAMGAGLARYFVSRAERALRDIREQDLFGKYLLQETIATGGMGEVMRATYCPEGGFTRIVAVKRIRDELSGDAKFVDAFCHEASLCAELAHPNIVQVLDFGRFRGAFMLAMEYVDGVSLSSLIRSRREPLDLAAVTLLGAELAAALDYIHAHRSHDGKALGLVHCDVNPPNVLVSRIGEVKLADFGVARAMGHLEADGVFHGKPAYAAPEQTTGAPLDGRTDLFALGITLHEALTGKRLFAGMVDFRSVPVVPAPSRWRPVPDSLERWIMRLLEIDPDRRPRTAGEVRAGFLELEGELAPYPNGERLLTRAVESATMGVGPEPTAATTVGPRRT